ncbi:MAG: zinc ribbon domain-containing protein [Oscillospiraceae bacterium]|nr:zinc ribbon domain-containing protein [Oscillospiraceae bacterium]
MTFDEMKAKIEEITGQISELEQTELTLCAELGKKIIPELAQDSEHAPLVWKINEAIEKRAGLNREKNSLNEEYQKQIKACTCFYCGTINNVGSAFCEECGKKLGELPPGYCTGCGWQNGPDMNFCGKCGSKLSKAEPQ